MPSTETEPCFPNAPRCTAMSKRTGLQCRAPALSSTDRCRFHRPWRRRRAEAKKANKQLKAALTILDMPNDPAKLAEALATLNLEPDQAVNDEASKAGAGSDRQQP